MSQVRLPDLSGLTLIVAEDTDDSLDVLTTFLQACGARVLAARNGLEALAYLETTPEVDAIVTDLAMPQMDGVELVRKLRDHPGRKPLVAIALTGFSGSTWRRAARASTRYWSSASTSISSAAPSRRWCRCSTAATAEDRRDRPAEIREIDRLDEVGGEAPRLHSRKIVREGGDRDHGYRAALLGRQVAEPVHEVGARSVG